MLIVLPDHPNFYFAPSRIASMTWTPGAEAPPSSEPVELRGGLPATGGATTIEFVDGTEMATRFHPTQIQAGDFGLSPTQPTQPPVDPQGDKLGRAFQAGLQAFAQAMTQE